MDSLPLKMLSELRQKFPKIEFVIKDPNEEIDFPEEVIILDTAVGISDVTIFDDLKKFAAVPRVSMHDFDALTNLRYLQKLGKIKTVKIIAVPFVDEKTTLSDLADRVVEILSLVQVK